MKRMVWLLMCASIALFAAPLHAADTVLISFSGFDYQDANLNGTYLDVGEGYRAVGDVTSVDPVLLGPYVDFNNQEYTFHMFGLTVASRFFNGGLLGVTFNNDGRGRYYEDDLAQNGGTHRDYGINPPNAASPSTFIDGPGNPIKLGGDIDNFALSYNFNNNQGNFQGNMTLDEGTALTYIPVGQRSGWILGGLAGPPNNTIAPGYDHQINGECRVTTTASVPSTWGAIKSLYR